MRKKVTEKIVERTGELGKNVKYLLDKTKTSYADGLGPSPVATADPYYSGWGTASGEIDYKEPFSPLPYGYEFEFSYRDDGCEICVTTIPVLAFVKSTPQILCYRQQRCADEAKLPDIPRTILLPPNFDGGLPFAPGCPGEISYSVDTSKWGNYLLYLPYALTKGSDQPFWTEDGDVETIDEECIDSDEAEKRRLSVIGDAVASEERLEDYIIIFGNPEIDLTRPPRIYVHRGVYSYYWKGTAGKLYFNKYGQIERNDLPLFFAEANKIINECPNATIKVERKLHCPKPDIRYPDPWQTIPHVIPPPAPLPPKDDDNMTCCPETNYLVRRVLTELKQVRETQIVIKNEVAIVKNDVAIVVSNVNNIVGIVNNIVGIVGILQAKLEVVANLVIQLQANFTAEFNLIKGDLSLIFNLNNQISANLTALINITNQITTNINLVVANVATIIGIANNILALALQLKVQLEATLNIVTNINNKGNEATIKINRIGYKLLECAEDSQIKEIPKSNVSVFEGLEQVFLDIFTQLNYLITCNEAKIKINEIDYKLLKCAEDSHEIKEIPKEKVSVFEGLEQVFLDIFTQLNYLITCIDQPSVLHPGEQFEELAVDNQLIIEFGLEKPTNIKERQIRYRFVVPKPIPCENLDWNKHFKPMRRTIGSVKARIIWIDHQLRTFAYFDTEDNAVKFMEELIVPLCSLKPLQADKNTSPVQIFKRSNPKRKPRNRTVIAIRAVYVEMGQDGEPKTVKVIKPPKE